MLVAPSVLIARRKRAGKATAFLMVSSLAVGEACVAALQQTSGAGVLVVPDGASEAHLAAVLRFAHSAEAQVSVLAVVADERSLERVLSLGVPGVLYCAPHAEGVAERIALRCTASGAFFAVAVATPAEVTQALQARPDALVLPGMEHLPALAKAHRQTLLIASLDSVDPEVRPKQLRKKLEHGWAGFLLDDALDEVVIAAYRTHLRTKHVRSLSWLEEAAAKALHDYLLLYLKALCT